jgi:ubiquinone/menaquinone biosynthesis C-methylase UbiE
MTETDPKELVRRGYNQISYRYRADDDDAGRYAPWIAAVLGRLAPGSAVLDLGCGCGIPVAKALADAGHAVAGVDFSEVQIERARELVPTAEFKCADATQVEFPDAAFDAVVSFYALIHIPVDEQPALLGRIARWLKPDGWLVATVGQWEHTGSDEDWLGGGAPMWWSQADAATYREWISQAGLTVESEEFIAEGTSGHALFWARRA